jgi:hypothetical protein
MCKRAFTIRVLPIMAGLVLTMLCGCRHGNESALDDRTLKDKPHVETEYPVNRADPFRP